MQLENADAKKSLKVSFDLDIGRQKISSNHKLILLIFASKDLSFFFVFFTAENVSCCETQPRYL